MNTKDPELKKAVERLHYWQRGGDSFTCVLYRMFQKADKSNYVRLAGAFPVEAQAHSLWFHSEDEDKFFESWGLTGKPIQDKQDEEVVIERLAAIEHEQWVEWSKSLAETEKLSVNRIERWKDYWKPYGKLSDVSKEHDRKWARKAFKVFYGIKD